MIRSRCLSSCSETHGSKAERIRNRSCAGGCQDLGDGISVGGWGATGSVQLLRGGELPAWSTHRAAGPRNSAASGTWPAGCDGETGVVGDRGASVSMYSLWRDNHGVSAGTGASAVLLGVSNWTGFAAFWASVGAGSANSPTAVPVAGELRITEPMVNVEPLAEGYRGWSTFRTGTACGTRQPGATSCRASRQPVVVVGACGTGRGVTGRAGVRGSRTGCVKGRATCHHYKTSPTKLGDCMPTDDRRACSWDGEIPPTRRRSCHDRVGSQRSR